MKTVSTLRGTAAILLWSTLSVLTALTGHVPPFELTALTFFIGGGLGTLYVVATGRAQKLLQPLPVWIGGIGGLFGYHALYFGALRLAPPAEAGLINYLWPLLIVLCSAFLPGLRLTARHLLGAALGFAGLILGALCGGRLGGLLDLVAHESSRSLRGGGRVLPRHVFCRRGRPRFLRADCHPRFRSRMGSHRRARDWTRRSRVLSLGRRRQARGPAPLGDPILRHAGPLDGTARDFRHGFAHPGTRPRLPADRGRRGSRGQPLTAKAKAGESAGLIVSPGWSAQASADLTLRIWRPRYMPVFRST